MKAAKALCNLMNRLVRTIHLKNQIKRVYLQMLAYLVYYYSILFANIYYNTFTKNITKNDLNSCSQLYILCISGVACKSSRSTVKTSHSLINIHMPNFHSWVLKSTAQSFFHVQNIRLQRVTMTTKLLCLAQFN